MDLRQASSCEELISPKYSTCRCTTRPPATRRFSTTLQVRCSLPSFLRVLKRRNIVGRHYRRASDGEQKGGRHYSDSDASKSPRTQDKSDTWRRPRLTARPHLGAPGRAHSLGGGSPLHSRHGQ